MKRLEPLTVLLSKARLVPLAGIGLLEVMNMTVPGISALLVGEP